VSQNFTGEEAEKKQSMASSQVRKPQEQEQEQEQQAVTDAARRRWQQVCTDPALYAQGPNVKYRYQPERCVRVRVRERNRASASVPPRGVSTGRGTGTGRATPTAAATATGAGAATVRVLRRMTADAHADLQRLVPRDATARFRADRRNPYLDVTIYTAHLFDRALLAVQWAGQGGGAAGLEEVLRGIMDRFELRYFKGRTDVDDIRAACRVNLLDLIYVAAQPVPPRPHR
jgi:hypothetical protein